MTTEELKAVGYIETEAVCLCGGAILVRQQYFGKTPTGRSFHTCAFCEITGDIRNDEINIGNLELANREAIDEFVPPSPEQRTSSSQGSP